MGEDGGLDLYLMVSNNPLAYYDYLGRKPKEDNKFNWEGFARWLKKDGDKVLNWTMFDKDNKTVEFLKGKWVLSRKNKIERKVENLSVGTYKLNKADLMHPLIKDNARYSHNAWISMYNAAISDVKSIILKIRNDKNCKKCKKYTFTAILSFIAWDVSDFNKGDRFGPLNLGRGDFMIWLRNNGIGQDYFIQAKTNSTVTIKETVKKK